MGAQLLLDGWLGSPEFRTTAVVCTGGVQKLISIVVPVIYHGCEYKRRRDIRHPHAIVPRFRRPSSVAPVAPAGAPTGALPRLV